MFYDILFQMTNLEKKKLCLSWQGDEMVSAFSPSNGRWCSWSNDAVVYLQVVYVAGLTWDLL